MQTAEETILQKTKELCQAIVEQPQFKEARRRVEAFMADETAVSQYRDVAEKSELLQHKEQMGSPVSNDEIVEFQKRRDALVNNPVARDFIEAQQELQQVQQTVNQYITKTLELGHVPSEDDLGGGSCGHGCGCHH